MIFSFTRGQRCLGESQGQGVQTCNIDCIFPSRPPRLEQWTAEMIPFFARLSLTLESVGSTWRRASISVGSEVISLSVGSEVMSRFQEEPQRSNDGIGSQG
eukprot:3191610-Pleurochrysis_carterae.AAC.1